MGTLHNLASLTVGLLTHFQLRYTLNELMTAILFQEIIAMYHRHGWELRRVLLRPDTRAALGENSTDFENADLRDDQIDALWFARASHAGREAWELRLASEQPYALFEAFEVGETESMRENKRGQMETRMREYVTAGK